MELLTTAEVSARYGVDASTVRRWCDAGHFPNAQRMGGKFRATWLIPESDLEGFKPPKAGNPNWKKDDKPPAGEE